MRSLSHMLIFAASGILLASCTTGLSPQRTTFTEEMAVKQTPAEWKQGVSPQAQNLSSLLALSSDKKLNTHVDAVLANNISLRQSVLDLQKAELEREKTSDSLWPTLTFNSSADRQRSKSAQGTSYASSVGGDLTVNWEADLWGKLSDRARASGRIQTASEHDLQAARASLAAQAMRNWVQLTALEKLADLDRSRISSLGNTEEIISDQFTRGIGELSDLEAARSATANAQSDLADRKLQIDQLKRQMQVAASQMPNTHFRTGSLLPNVKLPKGAMPATTLGRRPDLLAAYERAAAADLQHKAAYKDLLPSFSVNFSASDQSASLADLLNGGPAWRLLGSMSAPILDGGNRRLTAKQADLDAARLWLSYRQTLLTAVLEVENGLQNEQTLRSRETFLTRALSHSQSNYEQYERRYRDGLTDIVTLLSAERDAFAARQAVVNIRSSRMQNRVDLAVAFGIGL
ncbi:Cation efflux system protein CusC precursor [Pseudovibrio sp. Ad46]|uniref:TolC family protein n=1 Tax=unclassified Pseudovibrio TaxID=2627060 RepID=UPI0007AE61F0|nr:MULTISPECIES: TolC family protein [unclassified Pseudovibrio]KZK77215.1 Cation efflux system protein CusC precursor [Pseudovibrio sp. Ad46]KZK89709.1 Cation efflux system protein CusC precursor [Pseudovibrio sp. Ad5]